MDSQLQRKIDELTDQIYTVPENITSLCLSRSGMTAIGPEIAALVNLEQLIIMGTLISELPPEIAQLTNLKVLTIANCPFSDFPEVLTRLPKLEYLSIRSTQISKIPDSIRFVTHLKHLDLSGNGIASLPAAMNDMGNLQRLDLSGNCLKILPPEVALLPHLDILTAGGNPWIEPPPEIVDQGLRAIRTYFTEGDRVRVWNSKLILVGEGAVGKTSIVRRLAGEPFDFQEKTTHGIRISKLSMLHPYDPDIAMTLNAWDFGGQDIYHATHQFFLTNRSLYLLVWNARLGYIPGRIYDWIEAINARAPDSPIIIVSTHADERNPELPLVDIRRSYPNVKAHVPVSSNIPEGYDKLRHVIAREAAGLPLMGELWPQTWLRTADAIRKLPETTTTPAQLDAMMESYCVTGDGKEVLTRWLHDLGEILYYQNNMELQDIVILKPQWASTYISRVLDSAEVQARNGLLAKEHMQRLWKEVDAQTQEFLLRLMEEFDLSYRTLQGNDLSLVVEKLPLDEIENQELWDTMPPAVKRRTITMEYSLSSIPAGIPTWFIARSHRFSINKHWRKGAILSRNPDIPARPGETTLAYIKCPPNERKIILSTRGPYAHEFFSILRDGLELTLRRFPGLKITRTIPCPGHKGEPCAHRFVFEHLVACVHRDPPTDQMQCSVTGEMMSVYQLLLGIDISTQSNVIRRIGEMGSQVQNTTRDEVSRLRADMRDMIAVSQLNTAKMLQQEIDSECPSVFMIQRRAPREFLKRMKQQFGRQKCYELQLFCQAPGEWHPAEGEPYEILHDDEWLQRMAPHIRRLIKVLSVAAPILATGLSLDGYSEATKQYRANLELMNDLVKDLDRFSGAAPDSASDFLLDGKAPISAVGADLRALRELLDLHDPQHEWGGLRRIVTKESHVLWLCERHAAEHGLTPHHGGE